MRTQQETESGGKSFYIMITEHDIDIICDKKILATKLLNEFVIIFSIS